MASYSAAVRWGPIFFFAGILHIVSFLVILVFIPKIQLLDPPGEAARPVKGGTAPRPL